jgi:hypothetical protein
LESLDLMAVTEADCFIVEFKLLSFLALSFLED